MLKEQHKVPQKLAINLGFSLVSSPVFENLRELLLSALIQKESEVI